MGASLFAFFFIVGTLDIPLFSMRKVKYNLYKQVAHILIECLP
jgi:hypothetical protein